MSTESIGDCADVARVRCAIVAAVTAMRSVHGYRPVCGCGRVYVDVGKVRRGSKIARLLGASGRPMTPRPYCSYRMLYIGYDNATGKEWAMGEAFAAALQSAGFRAYVDGDGD